MKSQVYLLRLVCLLPFLSLLGGCAGNVITPNSYQMGVSGSAAGGTSVGAEVTLQRCARPLGTIALDNGKEADWYADFEESTGVSDIEPLLRLAIEQSNCFVMTAVGNAEINQKLSKITEMQRNSGEYRPGSAQEKGQRVAADYYLEPKIVVDSDTVTRAGALMIATGNPYAAAAGLLTGFAGSEVSVVTLSLFDIRSQVQISAAEGSATSTHYGSFLAGWNNSAGVVGAYSKSASGKATLTAFVDSWNKMVVALRNYKSQSVEDGLGQGGLLKVE